MSNKPKTINFEIVTPERVVLKEVVKQVTLPTEDGELTILPSHMPLVSILKPGVVEIVAEDGSREVAAVAGGFVEVLRNKVVLLADTAERACEINLKAVDEARDRAEESLKNIRREDKEQYANLAAVIAREMARSKAVTRWKKIKNL